MEDYHRKFSDALGSDLNTSMGITVLYDLLKESCNDTTKLRLLKEFDNVLSLNLLEGEQTGRKVDTQLETYIMEKIEERKAAKKDKDFARADAIREELSAKGVAIKDTREGTIWELI